MPKKTKYRKSHRGRRRGLSKGGNEVTFGDFGLQAVETSYITARQIEAARTLGLKELYIASRFYRFSRKKSL